MTGSARPGTHNHWSLVLRRCGRSILQLRPTMVMGPCVRRDDSGIYRPLPEIGWLDRSGFASLAAMKTAAQNVIARFESDIAARVAAIDWPQAEADLDLQGRAVLKGL